MARKAITKSRKTKVAPQVATPTVDMERIKAQAEEKAEYYSQRAHEFSQLSYEYMQDVKRYATLLEHMQTFVFAEDYTREREECLAAFGESFKLVIKRLRMRLDSLNAKQECEVTSLYNEVRCLRLIAGKTDSFGFPIHVDSL